MNKDVTEIRAFCRRIIELMPQFIRGFAWQEHNYLTKGKITLPQFWVMDYLSRQGAIQMSALAKYLNISRPAATGLIDRLLVQGLVKREEKSYDRRAVLIEITVKGKGIIESIHKQKMDAFIKIYSHLSMVERKQHLNILERIALIVQEIPAIKDENILSDNNKD